MTTGYSIGIGHLRQGHKREPSMSWMHAWQYSGQRYKICRCRSLKRGVNRHDCMKDWMSLRESDNSSRKPSELRVELTASQEFLTTHFHSLLLETSGSQTNTDRSYREGDTSNRP